MGASSIHGRNNYHLDTYAGAAAAPTRNSRHPRALARAAEPPRRAPRTSPGARAAVHQVAAAAGKRPGGETKSPASACKWRGPANVLSATGVERVATHACTQKPGGSITMEEHGGGMRKGLDRRCDRSWCDKKGISRRARARRLGAANARAARPALGRALTCPERRSIVVCCCSPCCWRGGGHAASATGRAVLGVEVGKTQ